MSYTAPTGSAVNFSFSTGVTGQRPIVWSGSDLQQLTLTLDPVYLGTGTPSSSTVLQGDGTWVTKPWLPLAGGTMTGPLSITGNTAFVAAALEAASSVFSTDRADIEFKRARGTISSRSAVTSADYLGFVRWRAYNATAADYAYSADIFAQADGAPSGVYVPGRLGFSTGDGTSNPLERVRIDKNGSVGFGAAPPGFTATLTTLNIGADSTLMAETVGGASNSLIFSQNASYQSSVWKYIETAAASGMYFNAGIVVFRRAASGTAGNAITWAETARIGTSGHFMSGTTSPVGQVTSDSRGSGSTYSYTGTDGVNYTFGVLAGSTGAGSMQMGGTTGTTSVEVLVNGAVHSKFNSSGLGVGVSPGVTIDSAGGVRAQGGAFRNDTAPSSAWTVDSPGANIGVSIANGATYDIQAGSGLVVLNSHTSAACAAFVCGGGATVLLGQAGGTTFVAGAPGAGQIGFVYNGAGQYRISNNSGSTHAIGIGGIRTRPSA